MKMVILTFKLGSSDLFSSEPAFHICDMFKF